MLKVLSDTLSPILHAHHLVTSVQRTQLVALGMPHSSHKLRLQIMQVHSSGSREC